MSRNSYNYGRGGYTVNIPSRASSQMRERDLDSSVSNYNAYLNKDLRSGSAQPQNPDLSHIKIDDLLNKNRALPSNPRNRGPMDMGAKSNSVRNLNGNGEFINKAFQMDELLRLRDQVAQLDQQNKQLKRDLEVRDKDVFELNEKLACLETDYSQLKLLHAEEISKKDKIIQKLK